MEEPKTIEECLEMLQDNRAETKAMYAYAEARHNGDKTMDLVKFMYRWNPRIAAIWHKNILDKDEENLKISRKLCELAASSKPE